MDSGTYEFIEQPHLFLEYGVDGVLAISLADRMPAKLDEQVKSLGVPVVWVNRTPSEGIIHVDADEVANGRILARHLIDLGHRHIAYVGKYSDHYSSHDRPDSIFAELESAGLSTKGVMRSYNPNWHVYDERTREIDRLLDLNPRPTAIICNYMSLYNEVVLRVSQRRLRIPQDISLAVFVSASEARHAAFTCLILPEMEMAQHGAQMLVDMMAGKAGESTKPLAGHLQVGKTTTPPPAVEQ